jgi:hypothetical protein
MLDYDAKPALEHRTRWAAAVAKVWDMRGRTGEVSEDEDRPGTHPENLFDFHDGLRLVVSTDRFDFGTYLHVSASARPDSKVYAALQRGMTLDAMIKLVCERVYFVSGGRRVTFEFLTPEKGVPHFYDPPLPVCEMT